MSDPERLAVSRRLHRAVAGVGGALADLLDASGAGRLGPIEDAAAFLRGMAQEAQAESHDPPITPDPLDRIVNMLGLSEVERTLLLLAGMPDEHEGYGTVLRALSPRSEPRATAGLAAQLLGGGSNDRAGWQDLAEHGQGLAPAVSVRHCRTRA